MSWLERLPEYGDKTYRGSEEIEGPGGLVQIGDVVKRATAIMLEEAKIGASCESPIETQLGARLRLELPAAFELVPQYWLGRYRMDFAIVMDGKACLFIECDGKDYHSTIEQQANDRAKNIACAAAQIPLLRFTGSSIYRHPDECVRQVVALVEGIR